MAAGAGSGGLVQTGSTASFDPATDVGLSVAWPQATSSGSAAKSTTQPSRLGLYGSVLGHCGRPEHAKLLRTLLEDPQRRFSSGIDGMLAGYVLLDKKEGWKYVHDILKDPSKDFLLRYAALRSARFFWDSRPDVVTKKDVVEAVTLLRAW